MPDATMIDRLNTCFEFIEKAGVKQTEFARASYCLERSIRRALVLLDNGNTSLAKAELNDVLTRAREKLPLADIQPVPGPQPQVFGRGIRQPETVSSAAPNGVVLRIDDRDRPEFWLEVCLPVAWIWQQLAQVELAKQLAVASEPGANRAV